VDPNGSPINQQGYLWNASFTPSAASASAINMWVNQE